MWPKTSRWENPSSKVLKVKNLYINGEILFKILEIESWLNISLAKHQSWFLSWSAYQCHKGIDTQTQYPCLPQYLIGCFLALKQVWDCMI
jgi:hypothetical protein